MTFTFVERMDEVLHLALLPPPSREIADMLREPPPGPTPESTASDYGAKREIA